MALHWWFVLFCSAVHSFQRQTSCSCKYLISAVYIALSLLFTACGSEDGNPGASASLTWNPVNDPSVVSYRVHYGKRSSGEFGSCNYENSFDVLEPFATVTGLEFDTVYHFAVSSCNGNRSVCSTEVTKMTRRLGE